ncbi:prolipoprotein diacylglyceryl transferase [Syntrophotalea acetylenivorans]|uniref:Phosphatidylglycerol--prolipoprotein diacylglyceryl transferase n=1 Tax=Syntrophotalea acetylenivorans TaxID=1842532 RepID=A0A1L3GSX4_9BACT|nr:prolipoprotein diacylglyceryl transferase [Syntrophotalea acetylenivorans]APG29019.1 prolipoprotein diacylglyceryl transferase [Syntrophotalea acetylenivorans]
MTYPQIDPVIFQIGPLAIRWYGLMYLLGFVAAYYLIRHLCRWRRLPLEDAGVSDLLFYCVLGVILGGRLGYVLFYDLSYYLEHPLQILAVWQGGMSFHGGLSGVVVFASIFCLRKKLPLLLTADVLVTAATIGLGLGRLGNFINGELWGRVTDAPWGMVFPGAGPLPRHPSQLYEAGLEGGVLFALLYLFHRRRLSPGVPFFSFCLLYGVFRFAVEFVREPDAHIGFLWGAATMGQLLSLPMVLIGLIGLGWVLLGRGRE